MLTDEIKVATSPIRLFIDEISDLKPLSRRLNAKLKGLPAVARPDYPDAYTFSLAGTATDLRIRALFNPAVHGESGAGRSLTNLEGVAAIGTLTADGYTDWTPNPWHQNVLISDKRRPPSRVAVLREVFEDFLAEIGGQTISMSNEQEDRLARFCVLFARIDHRHRGGAGTALLWELAGLDIPTMLDRAAEPAMVADVIALGRAFRARHPEIVAQHATARAGCIGPVANANAPSFTDR